VDDKTKIMSEKTKIIYLIRRSGTGKYTIAKELAKFGYKIADNHLINNPIIELLGYDGFAKIPGFAWDAMSKIRTAVLDFISEEQNNNYIMTNELLEDPTHHNFYNRVKNAANIRGSLFIPVILYISKEENAKRIANPDRALRYKLLKLNENHDKPLINITDANLLKFDVTSLSAKDAANKI
jgi:hypothetical protein